jgi:hypothetical protein
MLKDIIEMCKMRFGSYEKMAEKMDIDPTVICHWKAGRRKPNTIQIMQMAEFVGFDKYQTLCLVMEEIDETNAEIWKNWRPYGDSNPGYRRKRGTPRSLICFVKFCNLVLIVARHLSNRVNFQVLDVHIVVLCVYLNAPVVARRDKSERPVLLESLQKCGVNRGF